MIKLFLDTNVVLDVLAAREPFLADSLIVFSLCESGEAEGCASALTFCTVSYILRKFVTPVTMRGKLRDLRNVLMPVELSASLLDMAMASSLPDFEDAVQFYSAVQSGADYIISRDKRHFPQDSIPVLTPTEFLLLAK